MSRKEGSEPQATATQLEGPGGEVSKSARDRRVEEVRRKYDFGVIRTLRQQKGLTIEKFAKLCGLSYAPISRIETNLIKPNLETLDKIAEGLGISTYNLVALAERKDAVPQKAREHREGGFLLRAIGGDGAEIFLAEGRKGATTAEIDLGRRELATFLVSNGVLELRVNDKTFRLGPSEAVSLDCVYPHHYAAIEDVSFVVVLQSRR